ncbi:hypothetical protein RA27_22585 [Ruegeria sp. ANG-R]|nr:hypothetical protein RA27_22585 [Ruegeria sp. ANG-R]
MLVVLAIFELIGLSIEAVVRPYSETVGIVIRFGTVVVLPVAAIWYLVKYHARRYWYKQT